MKLFWSSSTSLNQVIILLKLLSLSSDYRYLPKVALSCIAPEQRTCCRIYHLISVREHERQISTDLGPRRWLNHASNEMSNIVHNELTFLCRKVDISSALRAGNFNISKSLKLQFLSRNLTIWCKRAYSTLTRKYHFNILPWIFIPQFLNRSFEIYSVVV